MGIALDVLKRGKLFTARLHDYTATLLYYHSYIVLYSIPREARADDGGHRAQRFEAWNGIALHCIASANRV